MRVKGMVSPGGASRGPDGVHYGGVRSTRGA